MKLLGFLTGLAAVFGAALLAGSLVDARPGRAAESGAMAEMDAQTVRGLAVTDRGLTLRLDTASARPGERFVLRFAVTRGGETVRGFDVEHTKRMHLILVRRDLTGFQHLHPVQAPDGSWSAPVTLPDPGTYRVYADFGVDGEAHTLAADLAVDGTVNSRALPATSTSATVDGLQVTRRGLAFSVTRGGKPVPIEDYLGAKGHLVALREGDLAFLHVHPDARRLAFESDLGGGRHRLFLQFKTGGRVHTAAFTA